MVDQAVENPMTSNGKLTFVVSLSSDHATTSRRKLQLQHSLIRSHAASIGHKHKKARNAHSITLSRRSHQASRQQLPEQQDCLPQWRTALYRPPPSRGLQVINHFDHAPDTRNGRYIYQLLQFYHTWTAMPDPMLTVAVKHKVCLYALTTYSAVLLRRLGLLQLSDHTVLSIRSTALSTMRSYLNSPKFELDAVLHALTCLCIGCTERGETIETRIHLEAMASIIGRKGMGSLPQYLQEIVCYCDIVAAVPSLSSTVFDFPDLSIETIRRNAPDEPSLTRIAAEVDYELTAAGAPPIYQIYAEQLAIFAKVLLHVHQHPASGFNLPLVFHQRYRMVSSCLAILNHAGSYLSSSLLCKRLTLIIILWACTLSAPISRCEYFSMFTDETISSFGSPETQVTLRQWNSAILSVRMGIVTDQNTIINQLSYIVGSEVERDFPSIGAFIYEYARLSLERCDGQASLAQGPKPVGITLRQNLVGPIIARWPIFTAM